jgi:glucose/arabinose dehydrogenase
VFARAATLVVVAALLIGCNGDDDDGDASRSPDGDGGARVETVAQGLEVPWEIAFLPDRSALITERPGRVRLLQASGELREEPVAEIEVEALGEGGLLGLAVDPDFRENRYVYLYLTRAPGIEIARYRYEDGRLEEEATIVDGIVAGAIHDSGRLHFGPDERLYFSTGDAGQSGLAQDPDSLNGKFLRLDPESYRGAGGDPEQVSLGHRNAQGFDWEPGSGRMVATEHGNVGNDEVNVIREGENYGWPEVEGEDAGEGFVAPVALYEQSVAPSGATFVERPGSAWSGDFLFATLVGEELRRLRFDGDEVTLNEALFDGRFGRLRTVVEGPDGALYVLTSNRDGRGSPSDADDRVLRVIPPPG